MTSKTVTEERFFETRQFPTRLYCDDHARRITGASTVREVDIPGSLSYTVLCTDSSDERPDLIVSFRQPESALGQTVIELARFIHGDLVPEATFHGKLPEYVQVLTHNDLSQTNILISKDNFEISGIVDWSLTKVLPFGMELDTLLLSTGYMDLSGWHSYTCRDRMIGYFWDEFWAHSRVFDDVRQHEIRTMAMQATKIGAVLRYAFQRNTDGSPSGELTTSNWALKTLKTLLCC
ncbi:hypothetical protein AtubIFM54640_007943 [Aspergillus tubingensis]|nr:hypothetical protein AtubIFM54640_007943 [Aspergillus tubingensis]